MSGWLSDGAEQFFAKYVPKMHVSRPENRWDFDYWRRDLRWRLYQYGSRHQEEIDPSDGRHYIGSTLAPR